ncbi:MAG: beta-propeller fold lactonase family protein [Chloroflexi bacterium]|nr:beta-propeller fold lactonase family protein [Chloroflexota bacterium]
MLAIALAPVLKTPVTAQTQRLEFAITDNPGRWFDTEAAPIGGTRSLGVVSPGSEVRFSGHSNTVHTVASLLFPTGAVNMPFTTEPQKGKVTVELMTPGLYVFFCQIHPYMFAAVIVDDPGTNGLDLGENITLINGVTIPTSSDLATRLLRAFFIATNPGNWQDYTSTALWHVEYPNVNVRIAGGAVVNLREVLNARYGNDIPLAALHNPETPGVGEVWVDTQFELTAGKEKPGTVTAVDTKTWQVMRKVALPDIEMNNPHNLWTNRDQTVIYQTQWFDSKLTSFDRQTGKLIENISVGESPAHVITSPANDRVYVTINGEEDTRSVLEFVPGDDRKLEDKESLDIGAPHPHAHWISSDGDKLVTPNVLTDDSSIFDLSTRSLAAKVPVGSHPLATAVTPDGSKYYVGNLLDSTVTVIDLETGRVIKTINLLENYDPVGGEITGPVGGLPIQTPVSPDGKNMITANTLTGTITVVDTKTDTIVAMLPADPGAHGVQFGAKLGGGYYAYVSNKFSNSLIVVDPDPNGDGDPKDARIAGRIVLVSSPTTAADDIITGNRGMGGQGVLPIPVVYNGWVQNLPASWADKLTPEQRNPLP